MLWRCSTVCTRVMQIVPPFLMIVLFESHGQKSCEWGKYGENCKNDCPLNCFINPVRNLRHCHKENGKCSEGCVPGWFHDLCDKACSPNCKGRACNYQNGICTNGCSGEYKGQFCNVAPGTSATPPREYSTYTSSVAPSESKTEKTPDLAAILVPVFLILVVGIAVAVIIIFLYTRKRNRGDTAGNIHAVTTPRNSVGEDELLIAEEGGATTGGDASCICSFVLLEDDNFPPGSLEQKIMDVQKVFVNTDSFKEVKEKLETFRHVTISGAPGEGKTSMALMLGDEYRKQGYELVLVEDADKVQLSDYLEKGKDVCVIFDDMFKTVRSYLDMSRLNHFLYDLQVHLKQFESRSERRYQRLQQESREEQRKPEQPNLCVIFTAETNNLQHAMSKLGGQHIFQSSPDVKLTCTQEEKKELWQKYKRCYECKMDVNNVFTYEKTTVGFPLECKLFSSCCGFQMHHDSFFEKPMFYITNQLHKIISSFDDKSAALILILLCDGRLNISQLDSEGASRDSQLTTKDTHPGDTEDACPISQLKAKAVRPVSQLKTKSGSPDSKCETEVARVSQLENEGASQDLEAHLQAVATLVKTSTRQGVAKAVRSFCGTLLTEGKITTFSHSVIYDVCASVLFSTEPKFTLKHCSIKFLLEHVQDQQDDGFPVNDHQLMIPFSEAYSGIIADRMADAIVSGAFSMYIWHPTWKRREISDKLTHMFTDPTSLSGDIKHNILHYSCFTGNKNILERLLPHCDINRRGLNGWTSVMYAVVSGQEECFDFLVKNKADITLCDSNNYNLLHLACQHGHKSTVKHATKALKKLLSPDLYLNQYINGRGVHDWTPVMCAVAFGKEDILDYLTKKGKTFERKNKNKVDYKLSDIHKNTVLHLACWFGNKSMVESLLPHTDINARGNNGRTPVMCALLSGRKEIFDLLVSKKADITLTDDDNKNLLDVASRVDDLSLLLSIVPKFDINSRGKHGWTPLMKAAVHGNIDVFHLFLHTVNVNLKLKDDNNNNLLHLACYGGNLSIVKLLLPKFDINSRGNNGWTAVKCAAYKGVESVFKLLVSKGADLRLRDDKNNTVLHLACFGGNISIVRDLLACTCTDINCLGSHGRTAIMITAVAAEPALFKLLLSKKANITLTDDDNNTVLHHACQGGNYSIVNILISKININTSGKHGWTPVMFAAWAGRKDVFDLLVKQNADLTLTDDYNDNVLHLACQGGSTAIVEYLVTPSDVSLRGKNNSPQAMHAERSVFSGQKYPRDGNAPTDIIQSSTSPETDNSTCVVGQSGKEATVKQVSGYFDINVKGRDDQTPLMRAVCGGHIAVFRFLVSHGADQNLVDKDGHTLLHLATQHGQLHMVKYIIHSFDISAKDNVGLTPVMTSVLHERVDVFEYLRKQGADLTAANNAGDDVATLAHKIGCSKIIEQLPPSKPMKRSSGPRLSGLFKSKKNRRAE